MTVVFVNCFCSHFWIKGHRGHRRPLKRRLEVGFEVIVGLRLNPKVQCDLSSQPQRERPCWLAKDWRLTSATLNHLEPSSGFIPPQVSFDFLLVRVMFSVGVMTDGDGEVWLQLCQSFHGICAEYKNIPSLLFFKLGPGWPCRIRIFI